MHKIMLYLWGEIIYFLSLLVPKSKNIWVFGSWGGKYFADNPKYFYEYVNDNHKSIKAIWLTRDKNILNNLRANNKKAYLPGSLKGLYYSSRASLGIVSHGMIDINRFACGRMKIINTWHGIPMKPVLLSDPKKASVNKRLLLTRLSYFFPYLKKDLFFNKNFLICSSSDYVTTILKKVFGKNAPLAITGFPRLDGLFKENNNSLLAKEIIKLKNDCKKVGIYMPTYRREGEFDIIKFFIENINLINKRLLKLGIILFLKVHPFDSSRFKYLNEYSNIRLINNKDIDNDIYSVLGLFDFLISDYSSVVFDFLILSRPIFLLTPDKELYIKKNGDFVFDYKNLKLPIISNWNEMMENLKNISSSNFLDKIIQTTKLFHLHKDGYSSKRLYNNVIEKI